MAFKRGTTPTITMTVDGTTFADSTVYATFEDTAGTQITKSSADNGVTKQIVYDDEGNPTGCILTVTLTQDESMGLDIGSAQVQLTWIDIYGIVKKSDISSIKIDRTLLEETVTYGG